MFSAKNQGDNMKLNMQFLKTTTIAFCICITASTTFGEQLLNTNVLNSSALWTGSSGNGWIEGTNLTTLLDGDPQTIWKADTYSYPRACIALSSPLPFVVKKVEVVISTVAGNADRSASSIEIMPVGTCDFISTGLAIGTGETGGETIVLNMPLEFQIPISAIRIKSAEYWFELNELSFYGEPVVAISRVENLTHIGTFKAYRDDTIVVQDVSALTNSIYEGGSGGYHQSVPAHNIIVDFGATPKKTTEAYVAVNPNGYWKYPWAAIGTQSSYTAPGDLELFSDYTPTPINVTSSSGTGGLGHSWIVMPVTNKISYALGVRINNHWGDICEFRVLNIAPRAGTVLLIN